MKKYILVIDNFDNSKVLLKKILLVAPDDLLVLFISTPNTQDQHAPSPTIEASVEEKIKQVKSHSIEYLQAATEEQLAEQIIQRSEKFEADLILLQKPRYTEDSHETNFAKLLLRGSIKANLFFCRNKKWKSPPDIMCALDVADTDATHKALDEFVFNAASSTKLSNLEARLHLASIIPVSKVSKEFDIVDESRLLQKKGDSFREKLQKFNERSPDQSATIHVTAGVPEKQITLLVKKNHIDVLVMGNVGRKGLKGFVLGNTAEKIITNLAADVLVINNFSSG